MADFKRWLVLLGGTMIHLTLGSLYTFGNIQPYFTSYLRSYSKPEDLRYTNTIWIFTFGIAFQGIFMFVGGIIENKIGARWTSLLGGWIMSLGILLTKLTIEISYLATVFTYGCIFGIGIGIAYAPPLACVMQWWPHRKGLVNGIVVAGFGGGAFIFNQVQTAFINPNNLSPDTGIAADPKEKYYIPETAEHLLERVPNSFILLGSIYACLQLIGSLLLFTPPDNSYKKLDEDTALMNREKAKYTESSKSETSVESSIEEPPKSLPDMHPLDVLKTRAFYTLWWIFVANGQINIFISTLYKPFGQTFISDDRFLTVLGSCASVCNSLGRVLWGKAVDRFSFRISMTVLCSLLFCLMITLISTQSIGRIAFFIWVLAIYLVLSGNYALLPTVTARAFGPKYVAVNYGLVFSSQAVTGVIGAVLPNALLDLIGWAGMFAVMAAFSMSGALMAYSFNVKTRDGKEI